MGLFKHHVFGAILTDITGKFRKEIYLLRLCKLNLENHFMKHLYSVKNILLKGRSKCCCAYTFTHFQLSFGTVSMSVQIKETNGLNSNFNTIRISALKNIQTRWN